MVEGYVTDAFETSSGSVWYQARNSDGDVYHVKQGEGQKYQTSYAAAKTHNLTNSIAENRADIDDIIDNMEMIDTRTVDTSGLELGTLERALGSNRNQMLGYIYAKYDEIENEEDWQEALEDYSQFVDEIESASSDERREEIRENYNVGGS